MIQISWNNPDYIRQLNWVDHSIHGGSIYKGYAQKSSMMGRCGDYNMISDLMYVRYKNCRSNKKNKLINIPLEIVT